MTDNFETRGDEQSAIIEAATVAARVAGEHSFAEHVQNPGAISEGLGVVTDETVVSTGGMDWIRDWGRQRRFAIGATLATAGLTGAVGWGASAYASGNEVSVSHVSPGVLDPTSTSPTDPSSTDTSSPEPLTLQPVMLRRFPNHRYNVTDDVLAHDGAGWTITGATNLAQEPAPGFGQVKFNKAKGELFVTPNDVTGKPLPTFEVDATRASDGATGTVEVTLDVNRLKLPRFKLLKHDKVRLMNPYDNAAFQVEVYKRGGHFEYKRWIKSGESIVEKRRHPNETVFGKVTRAYRILSGNVFIPHP